MEAPISAISHCFCIPAASFCEVIAGYHQNHHYHRYQYLFIKISSQHHLFYQFCSKKKLLKQKALLISRWHTTHHWAKVVKIVNFIYNIYSHQYFFMVTIILVVFITVLARTFLCSNWRLRSSALAPFPRALDWVLVIFFADTFLPHFSHFCVTFLAFSQWLDIIWLSVPKIIIIIII